jgi:hypothetical protein
VRPLSSLSRNYYYGVKVGEGDKRTSLLQDSVKKVLRRGPSRELRLSAAAITVKINLQIPQKDADDLSQETYIKLFTAVIYDFL